MTEETDKEIWKKMNAELEDEQANMVELEKDITTKFSQPEDIVGHESVPVSFVRFKEYECRRIGNVKVDHIMQPDCDAKDIVQKIDELDECSTKADELKEEASAKPENEMNCEGCKDKKQETCQCKEEADQRENTAQNKISKAARESGADMTLKRELKSASAQVDAIRKENYHLQNLLLNKDDEIRCLQVQQKRGKNELMRVRKKYEDSQSLVAAYKCKIHRLSMEVRRLEKCVLETGKQQEVANDQTCKYYAEENALLKQDLATLADIVKTRNSQIKKLSKYLTILFKQHVYEILKSFELGQLLESECCTSKMLEESTVKLEAMVFKLQQEHSTPTQALFAKPINRRSCLSDEAQSPSFLEELEKDVNAAMEKL